MNRLFFIILGIVVALALITYVGLQFFLGSAVKTGVNRYGPHLTRTEVQLASASISPFSGAGTLTGLYVGNPAGWSADKAFSFGEVHIDMEPFSVMSDHVVINELVVERPEFVYETRLVASNIGEILENIEQAIGGKRPEAAPQQDGEPVKFEVKHFLMQNGRVTVGVGTNAVTLPLPAVELHNLGTNEGGITADQLAAAIMRSVTTSVVGAATKSAGKIGTEIGTELGGAAAETIKKTAEELKGIFTPKK